VNHMSDTSSPSRGQDRRWLILGVIGIGQLMVVLDLTIMNVALPSAQRALHFSTVDRQWVVTAYALAFGSLLLLGGRLADLLGRKVTFLAGLIGFAGVSAIGGASVNFAMLITARACQGAFAALLVPSALSLLTTTFTDPKDRGKAFGIYGAIAGGGGAVGLLLGGALTQYLSWRWTLYVNLLFAAVAFVGGAVLLTRQPSPAQPRLDILGVVLVSGSVFCLVYGFSNAAIHSWHAPATDGFLGAGVVLGAVFALWQGRAAHPLLPPRVVLDRNRGGAYVSMLVASAGLFGTFLFLTYYLQQTLGYSPLATGVAFLPLSGGLIVAANTSTIVLMPRFGPKPLITLGMLIASAGAAWLAQLGPHTGYAAGVLGPLLLVGVGVGLVIAPVINTGIFGVAPQDAGVASATVTVAQQLGASVGTPLLNTIFAGAVTSYVTANLTSARLIGRPRLTALSLAHGYDSAFWWITGILAGGAVLGGVLLRPGPLDQRRAQTPERGGVTMEQSQVQPAAQGNSANELETSV
jgi:EmrB/QacA subfamily drug resistance transporter